MRYSLAYSISAKDWVIIGNISYFSNGGRLNDLVLNKEIVVVIPIRLMIVSGGVDRYTCGAHAVTLDSGDSYPLMRFRVAWNRQCMR